MNLLDINFNKLTGGEEIPTTFSTSSSDGKNKFLVVSFSLLSATNGIFVVTTSATSTPPNIINATWKKFNPFVKQGGLPYIFLIVTYKTYY